MSPVEVLLLLAAAVLGGAVQSVLGFGAAVMTVPMLAVVEPELLPVASMIAMLPLITTMAWRGRRVADLAAAGRMLLGRIPGVAVGSALVLTLDTRALTLFVALILLVAVASMSRGWQIAITPRTQATAGFVSAVTGTSTGLGGPPLALLYQRVAGAHMRATLAVVFLGGVLMSLGTLAVLGEVLRRDLVVGVPMGGATLVGMLLTAPLVRRLSDATLRRGVLAWAAVGAVAAMTQALFG